MERAVFESGATLLNMFSRRFPPQGVTVIIAISESHLSIHTWPEQRYAAIDIFTCGTDCMPFKALRHLRVAFRPGKVETVCVSRGRKSGLLVSSFAKSGTCCSLIRK